MPRADMHQDDLEAEIAMGSPFLTYTPPHASEYFFSVATEVVFLYRAEKWLLTTAEFKRKIKN